MVDVEVKGSIDNILKVLQKHIGPKRYWIHNRIGGIGWNLDTTHGKIRLQIADPAVAVWVLLKLNQNT